MQAIQQQQQRSRSQAQQALQRQQLERGSSAADHELHRAATGARGCLTPAAPPTYALPHLVGPERIVSGPAR